MFSLWKCVLSIPCCDIVNQYYNLAGNSWFPDYQHADGAAQLFLGAAAVPLSNRGSRGSTAGAPDPSQSHWQAWQQTQVCPDKVCNFVCRNLEGLKLKCYWFWPFCVWPSFCVASSLTSLCWSSKLTNAPDKTIYSWKRYACTLII